MCDEVKGQQMESNSRLPDITNGLVHTSLYGYIMSYSSCMLWVLCNHWYDIVLTQEMYILGKSCS